MATGRIGTTPVLQVRWSKAPSAGTTSLSGLDDNSVSLVYSVGYEAVYRNGVLLSRTNDYTATDGTTITLIDATIAGDIIEVFANQTIPLADTYSQTVANGKFINNTLTTTTGDIIYASAANTPARLGIGTAGQVLTVNSGATAPEWKTAGGGGKVLQVVQAIYNTPKTIASTTYTDTDLTLNITPTSATSKVLVMVQQFIKFEKLNTSPFPTSETLGGTLKIVRGATDIYTLAAGGQGAGGFYQDLASGTQGDLRLYAQVPMIYLDSPATTSSTTYKTQGKAEGTDASGKIVCQSDSTYSSITLMEIGA